MTYVYNARTTRLRRFYYSTWGMYALTLLLLIVAGLVALHEMYNIIAGFS